MEHAFGSGDALSPVHVEDEDAEVEEDAEHHQKLHYSRSVPFDACVSAFLGSLYAQEAVEGSMTR